MTEKNEAERALRVAIFEAWDEGAIHPDAIADAVIKHLKVEVVPCPHRASRLKFDGGNRSIVCNSCNHIITRLEEPF